MSDENTTVDSLTAEEQAEFSQMKEAHVNDMTKAVDENVAQEDAETDASETQKDKTDESQDAAENTEGTKKAKHVEGYVPQAVVAELRAEKRKAQEALEQLQRQNIALTERFNVFNEITKEIYGDKAQEQNKLDPAFEEDPIKFMLDEVKSLKQQISEKEQREKTQQEQRALVETAVKTISEEMDSAQKENSDFNNAVSYLCDIYSRGLRLENPNLSDREIDARLANLAFSYFAESKKANTSLGDYIFEMAKRNGYTPKQSLDRAVNTARTLTATGGASPDTGKNIDQLSDEEIYKLSYNNPDALAKLIQQSS